MKVKFMHVVIHCLVHAYFIAMQTNSDMISSLFFLCIGFSFHLNENNRENESSKAMITLLSSSPFDIRAVRDYSTAHSNVHNKS